MELGVQAQQRRKKTSCSGGCFGHVELLPGSRESAFSDADFFGLL